MSSIVCEFENQSRKESLHKGTDKGGIATEVGWTRSELDLALTPQIQSKTEKGGTAGSWSLLQNRPNPRIHVLPVCKPVDPVTLTANDGPLQLYNNVDSPRVGTY